MNRTIVVGNRLVNDLRMRLETPVRSIRNAVLRHERTHRVFERIVDVGRSGLEELSRSQTEIEDPTPSSVIAALAEHYDEPNSRLEALVDRPVPETWGAHDQLLKS